MSVKALILCLSRDCVQSSSPCQWDGLSDSLLRSRGEHSASCPSGRLGHKSHFGVLLASSLGLLALGVPTATSREALGKGLYDRNRVFLPKASKEFRHPPHSPQPCEWAIHSPQSSLQMTAALSKSLPTTSGET